MNGRVTVFCNCTPGVSIEGGDFRIDLGLVELELTPVEMESLLMNIAFAYANSKCHFSTFDFERVFKNALG